MTNVWRFDVTTWCIEVCMRHSTLSLCIGFDVMANNLPHWICSGFDIYVGLSIGSASKTSDRGSPRCCKSKHSFLTSHAQNIWQFISAQMHFDDECSLQSSCKLFYALPDGGAVKLLQMCNIFSTGFILQGFGNVKYLAGGYLAWLKSTNEEA